MQTKTTTTRDEEPRAEAESTGERAAERRDFAAQFTPSPRNARRARRLVLHHMGEWGYPPDSDASCTVGLLVAELTANAVLHGRVPGRRFALRLSLDGPTGVIRVEVADAAGTKRPPDVAPTAYPEGESGRGLLLVDALATRWGWTPRRPLGKTVWAEVATREEPPPSESGPVRG